MTDDYSRSQITRVIQAGPHKGDEQFRLQVQGTESSKWLNVNRDQLVNLADAMDETNLPSLLPLQNGHRVIKAEVEFSGMGQGVVLVDLGEEQHERYVIWRVFLHKGECRWLAEHGEYTSDYARAIDYYNTRRGAPE